MIFFYSYRAGFLLRSGLIIISIFTLLDVLNSSLCLAYTSIKIKSDSLKAWDSLIRRNLIVDNGVAERYALKSLKKAELLKDTNGLILAYYDIGRVYQKKDPERSYSYLSTALKMAKTQKENTLYPEVIYYMALINNLAYNNKDALILLDTCIHAGYRTGNFSIVSQGLSLMGAIGLESTDSVKAEQLFDSAYYIAKKHSLDFQKGIAISNKALLKHNPVEKIFLDQQALKLIARTPGTEEEYASILVNLGFAYNNPDSAYKYNQAALIYAEKYSINAIIISAYNNLAYFYLDKKQFQEAIKCLTAHAIPIAASDNNHDWLSSLYDSYAEILYASGNFKRAAEVQKMALTENTRADLQFSSKQIRLLSSILELKQKDLEISNDKKQILIQESELSRTRFISAIIILGLLSSLVLVFLLFQRSRIRFQKRQIESARKLIEMEETDKNRIAMEIHDSFGPGFQSVILSLGNVDHFTIQIRDKLIVQVNVLWNDLRTISHRMSNRILGQLTFQESISELCDIFRSTDNNEIILKINGDFNTISEEISLHIYRIIQEMLTNARKYAKKGTCYLTVSNNNSKLTIYYLDDGPGFNVQHINGLGVSNIFERVFLMNGKAHLETSPGNATSWDISIPVKINK